jgi:hypothetical protein
VQAANIFLATSIAFGTVSRLLVERMIKYFGRGIFDMFKAENEVGACELITESSLCHTLAVTNTSRAKNVKGNVKENFMFLLHFLDPKNV